MEKYVITVVKHMPVNHAEKELKTKRTFSLLYKNQQSCIVLINSSGDAFLKGLVVSCRSLFFSIDTVSVMDHTTDGNDWLLPLGQEAIAVFRNNVRYSKR